jgi:hypothetical protein
MRRCLAEEGCSREAEPWSNYCQLHRPEPGTDREHRYRDREPFPPPPPVDTVQTIVKDPDGDDSV